MKKITKIMGVLFAFVLAAMTPLLFTGCKQSISLEDASKAMVEAGREYFGVHEDHENFADTTITFNTTYKRSAEHDLTYKNEANEEVEDTFTDTMDVKQDMTIVVKNVTRGEGDATYNVVHLALNVVTTTKTHTYALDGQEHLQEANTDTTTTKVYTLATAVENNQVYYYVTLQTTTQEAGVENATVTKRYYKYAGVNTYLFSLDDYLDDLNEFIEEGYFGLQGEYLMLFGQFAKDGNKVEVSGEMTYPLVEASGQQLIKVTRTVVYDGKNLDTATATMNGDMGAMQTEMTAIVKVVNGADAVEVPDLAGYAENLSEITLTELPDDDAFDF